MLALVAVLGPGLLAGPSDDSAGITTYSIPGADYGYRLLWVLTLSTLALIVFRELAARMGVVTGKGLMGLVRERYGRRATNGALAALLVANLGTICAEFAGVAAGMQILAGPGPAISVPVVAAAVSVLVLRGSFGRVEHSCSPSARSSSPTWSPGCWRIPTGMRPPAGSSSRACPHARGRAGDRRDGEHDARPVGPGVHPVLRA